MRLFSFRIHDHRPLAGNACFFFFFHLISRSHFSHPSFTNCKLHTRMLTDADLWRVRCSPIDLGFTHKVKKTPGPGSSGLGSSVKTSTPNSPCLTVTRLKSFSPHGGGRFSIGSSQTSPSPPGHRRCLQCPMSGLYLPYLFQDL